MDNVLGTIKGMEGDLRTLYKVPQTRYARNTAEGYIAELYLDGDFYAIKQFLGLVTEQWILGKTYGEKRLYKRTIDGIINYLGGTR
jgi:hypothetical protein